MVRASRRLDVSFRQLMDRRQAWPKGVAFQKWLKEQDEGIKNGAYAEMIQGYAVRALYVVRFVRFVQHAVEEAAAARRVLSEFLQGEHWQSQSAEQVAAELLAEDEKDVLRRGVQGIWDAINAKRMVDSHIAPCRSEADVTEAIKWMFVLVAHHISRFPGDLNFRQSIDEAERYMQIGFDEYVAKAIGWWRFDPWTVIRVQGRKAPVGMSIVLPLKDGAYESLKAGGRMSYDIRPDELQRPSCNLLVEMVGERLPIVGGEPHNAVRNTLIAVLSQEAILSHPNNGGSRDNLRLLSFAGTPANRERSESFGFEPLGITMPGTDIEWMEKNLQEPMTFMDSVYLGLLWVLGAHPDRRLIPPTMVS
jgi:hypothetical protein